MKQIRIMKSRNFTVAKAYMSCVQSAGTAGIEINTDGITYDVGDEYTSSGSICVDVEIHYAPKGLFGGNSLIRNGYTIKLTLHKASTPDGEKWFVGKPKSSVLYIDETGLM